MKFKTSLSSLFDKQRFSRKVANSDIELQESCPESGKKFIKNPSSERKPGKQPSYKTIPKFRGFVIPSIILPDEEFSNRLQCPSTAKPSETILIARIDPKNDLHGRGLLNSSYMNSPLHSLTTKSSRSTPATSYKTIEFGKPGTLQHRVLFRRNGWQDISPWHDIPLFEHQDDSNLLNFVCTTPKGQWIQTEVAGNEKLTPLRVQQSHGRPSHYAQNLPYNYGFFPQTAMEIDFGKQEPVRVFDVGNTKSRKAGDVFAVKPVAAFLVADDESESSWHVIAIDAEDEKARSVHGLDGLAWFFPGLLEEITGWLRTRNCVHPGNAESVVAQGGMPSNRVTAMEVIEGSHESWKFLHERGGEPEVSFNSLRPMLAEELEEVWEVHTAGLSSEVIELKESKTQPSLKYEKAWEIVMSKEENEGNELGDREEVEQPSSWINVFSLTPKVFSRRVMSFPKCQTEPIRFQESPRVSFQESPRAPYFRTFSERVSSPLRAEKWGNSLRTKVDKFCFTPPRAFLNKDVKEKVKRQTSSFAPEETINEE